MRYTPLEIPGAYLIEATPIADDRGYFAMMWSAEEFASHGLNPRLEQASLSYNHLKGTVRGMHYQEAPHEEVKLIRCQSGSIFDIVLDLRRDSPTFTKWVGVTLSSENLSMLYIPEGCAHGFQTLADRTEVYYLLSRAYAPTAARGVRWDDPAFGISWPLAVTSLSERDRTHPDFSKH